jgi:hypothetical protein
MPSETLYALPSDILTDSATISLTAGTADAAFPLTNLYDRYAHTVFKTTGTSCTIHVVFGGSKTLQGIAFINHKLAGCTVTVTNSAGFNRTVTIPTTPGDGLPLDPWDDWRTLANTSSTTWNIAISGAATVVAIGELLLIETLRTLQVRSIVKDRENHKTSVMRADSGVKHKYGFGVRTRGYTITVIRESQRAAVLALERDSRGELKNFLFVLDSAVNDALYVDLAMQDVEIQRGPKLIVEVELILEEQQKGLAL